MKMNEYQLKLIQEQFKTLKDKSDRITSYNVCYTKLLRVPCTNAHFNKMCVKENGNEVIYGERTNKD